MTVAILEVLSIPDSLVEKSRQTDRKAFRAVTTSWKRRVFDVGLVVMGVNIDAVPASREHQLSADTVGTVGVKVGLVWHEVTVEGGFAGLGIVKAVKPNSDLLQEGLGVVRFLVPE